MEELEERGEVDGIISSLSGFTETLKVTAEYGAGNRRTPVLQGDSAVPHREAMSEVSFRGGVEASERWRKSPL